MLINLNSLTFSTLGTILAFNRHAPLHPPPFSNSRRVYTVENFPKISFGSVPAVATQTEIPIVVGYGLVTVDFLATVASFPKPDEKMTTTSLKETLLNNIQVSLDDRDHAETLCKFLYLFDGCGKLMSRIKVQGGGNVGNALTCVARLGLKSRLISKVANDPQGKGILEELEADGVDTSFVVVSRGGTSTVSYVIVDGQNKTRTCLYTPVYPPMKPDDLTQSSVVSVLDSARILFIDGLVHETAFALAQEAFRMKIPILVEAERIRDGTDDLLMLADYVVCSAKFPQAWTKSSSISGALVTMLLRMPNVKFVIVTLGENGCLMVKRSAQVAEEAWAEEIDVESLLSSLHKKNHSSVMPTCFSSPVMKLRADSSETLCGMLFVGTAEKIPPSELIDTTGAGDAFIGAVLYAICTNMPPDKMLPFAAQVAAAKCRCLGARTGLPYIEDPLLASFLH